MTHTEFIDALSQKFHLGEITGSMFTRLVNPTARLSPGWCRDILEAAPECEEYLRRRDPESMDKYDRAMERHRRAVEGR